MEKEEDIFPGGCMYGVKGKDNGNIKEKQKITFR